MNYKSKLAEELAKTNNVIQRSDGVILLNRLGDPNIYPLTTEEGQRELDWLNRICEKRKINYTYKLVLYHTVKRKGLVP